MRPRHVLLLTVLAALPVLLAFLLVGNGSLSAPATTAPARSAAPAAQISLHLVGAASSSRATQCGTAHGYKAYPSQGTIRFRGSIAPAGGWQVTVKLKACYGGAFQSAGDARATVRPNGTYEGGFPIPIGGYYYARAEVKHAGQQVGRSGKVYFEVR